MGTELQNVTDMADISCVKILEGWGKKCDITLGYAREKAFYCVNYNN